MRVRNWGFSSLPNWTARSFLLSLLRLSGIQGNPADFFIDPRHFAD
jgi:hypothetical protein